MVGSKNKTKMKKLIYIFALIAMFVATGCQKENNPSYPFLGDWHYTATEQGVSEDVWVSFLSDGTFEMYQKLGEGPYWFSKGEYTYDNASKVLSGVYSDRYPWKYSYKVTVAGNALVMEATELEGYTVTYTSEEIPAAVREKCLPLTKAESVVRHL